MSKRKVITDWNTVSLAEQIAAIPTRSIATIVGNLHVSTSDSEVAEDWRIRAESSGQLSAYQVRRIVQVALAAHHDNQRLYRYVLRGSK